MQRTEHLIKAEKFASRKNINVVLAEPDHTVIKVEMDEELLRVGNILNGGLACYFMDLCGALSVFSNEEILNAVTVSLDTKFMDTVKGDHFIVESWVKKKGGKLFFVEIVIKDSENKKCISASGIWNVYR
ncbi:PaaI family thioesterase [Caldiplasma sukawensis]